MYRIPLLLARTTEKAFALDFFSAGGAHEMNGARAPPFRNKQRAMKKNIFARSGRFRGLTMFLSLNRM
jgi:hypothetical protein